MSYKNNLVVSTTSAQAHAIRDLNKVLSESGIPLSNLHRKAVLEKMPAIYIMDGKDKKGDWTFSEGERFNTVPGALAGDTPAKRARRQEWEAKAKDCRDGHIRTQLQEYQEAEKQLEFERKEASRAAYIERQEAKAERVRLQKLEKDILNSFLEGLN